MGKKKIRKSVTSKGQRPNVAKSTLKAVAREVSELDKSLNLLKAWRKGHNPWVTVPSSLHSNKPFIKVRANSLWGSPKYTYSDANFKVSKNG